MSITLSPIFFILHEENSRKVQTFILILKLLNHIRMGTEALIACTAIINSGNTLSTDHQERYDNNSMKVVRVELSVVVV